MIRLLRWCLLATIFVLVAPACSGPDQKKGGDKSWRVEKSKRKRPGKSKKGAEPAADTAKHPAHEHTHRHPHGESDHHHHAHPHPHLPGPDGSHHP